MKWRIREVSPGGFRVERKGGLWWTGVTTDAPGYTRLFVGDFPIAPVWASEAIARSAMDEDIRRYNHRPRVVVAKGEA